MLTVKTPTEVFEIIKTLDVPTTAIEEVALEQALGRVLAQDVTASEYIPDFDRSTVDGFAVRGEDTFGCSDSIPAILTVTGSVQMGCAAEGCVAPGTCMAIPTGGALPKGADAVVMVEYTEDYGDGTVGILKSTAPGANLIYRGDDVFPGKLVLSAGRVLTATDLGALAAMGITTVPVRRPPVVGILSTGDELVNVSDTPGPGQVRDVNSTLLAAVITSMGGKARPYGALNDVASLLEETVQRAVDECDCVLISGGSSVGEKDATCQVIQHLGTLLFHGIAMKPGKPTILGMIQGKPVMGLPGHPVAAFFVAHLFVRQLLGRLLGRCFVPLQVQAVLSEPVSADHGRAQYTGVHLKRTQSGLIAVPIRSKSGLIGTLAGSDGYFHIARDCEGVPAGAVVSITVYHLDQSE